MTESDDSADKVPTSVRLPADTAAYVEEYAEERGISESDAHRRLLDRGREWEERVGEVAEAVGRIEEEMNEPGWWERLWRRVS